MKNIRNFLINLDNDLWDLMGIECGSDFMNEDGSMNGKFDAYCKAVENELQANNVHSVSEKVYRELEDVNYHTIGGSKASCGLEPINIRFHCKAENKEKALERLFNKHPNLEMGNIIQVEEA